MSMYQHIRENLFITATGVAAFVHTTWAIGTLFSGSQPAVSADISAQAGLWLAQTWALVAWLVPPMLIAFALDVGQIVTSYRIRQDHLRGAKPYNKYVTFAVFALATYYLQWAYMAHHLPALQLAAGVRPDWVEFVGLVRDMSLWIVPLLLPASTMLYTISDMEHEAHPDTSAPPAATHTALRVRVDVPTLPDHTPNPVPDQADTTPAARTSSTSGQHTGEASGYVLETVGGFMYTCPRCGKQDVKDTRDGAQAALNVHLGRWCKAAKLTEVVSVDAE